MTIPADLHARITARQQQLRDERARLDDPTDLRDRMLQAIQQGEQIDSVEQVLRLSTVTLGDVLPKIERELQYEQQLKGWDEELFQEEVAAMAGVKYPTPAQLSEQQSRVRSMLWIKMGIPLGDGHALRTSPLGVKMARDGYIAPPPPKDEPYKIMDLPWYGSLEDVKRRLKALSQQRDEALSALEEALLTDEQRVARLEATKKKNARPQRKTRGDGSTFDRYLDGRVEEVSAAPKPQVESKTVEEVTS
jgi:hypothetical protein